MIDSTGSFVDSHEALEVSAALAANYRRVTANTYPWPGGK